GVDQPDLRWQVLFEERSSVRRAERHVSADGSPRGGGEDIIADIAQERGIALRRFFEGQGRNQAGLAAPGNGGLRHDGNPASRNEGVLAADNRLAHDMPPYAPIMLVSRGGIRESDSCCLASLLLTNKAAEWRS